MTEDERCMRLAMEEAEKAAALKEVPIGCVIVRDGAVVGRGHNRRETGKSALFHAELTAIREACETLGGWRLPGCTLYVTLEPCPMCAGAMINARIPRVVYAAADPKAGAVGSIISLFTLPFNHKPEVTAGVLGEECGAMLTDFFRALRKERKAEKEALQNALQNASNVDETDSV